MTTTRTGIRALIVDDEPAARDAIRSLLAGDADIRIVGECADGRTALRAIVLSSASSGRRTRSTIGAPIASPTGTILAPAAT